jgi:maleamate amidohydrolase
MSTLLYHLRMIMVEDGVFERGQASNSIELWDMQARYADVIPSQQVIEQMDRMSTKRSPPREV